MSTPLPSTTTWTTREAIDLCVHVEQICPGFGCHVGLTGGCLYKYGPRKDLDLVFYRIRQSPKIDVDSMLAAFARELGFTDITGFGFCYKARLGERGIDMFFPEEQGGVYEPTTAAPPTIDQIFEIGKEGA